MPDFTKITIRIALIQFLVGWTLGTVLLLHKSGVHLFYAYATLRELHFHVLAFGFLVQLCIGMCFWILPKFVADGMDFRGNQSLAVGSVIALNCGVFISLFTSQITWFFYALAAGLFVFHIWPRVKPFANTHKSESL